jgi:thiol-disulfide isomerase/thioredoxin
MSVKAYRSNAPTVSVLFVKAEWCPHCQSAKPEMAKAAAVLGSVVPVYAVDSERNKAVVQKLGVEGFPTILFRDARGKLHPYEGPRTGQKIADWVCSKSGMCGGR